MSSHLRQVSSNNNGTWEIEPGDKHLISVIQAYSSTAQFFVYDEYETPPDYILNMRVRYIKDPHRVRKDLYVQIFANEEKILDWAKQNGRTIETLADSVKQNELRSKQIQENALAKAREYESQLATSQPIAPVKPAMGRLLPQMPLPPHLKR